MALMLTTRYTELKIHTLIIEYVRHSHVSNVQLTEAMTTVALKCQSQSQNEITAAKSKTQQQKKENSIAK